MKVAYLSSAFLADCDLPLLHQLHLMGVEVHYFLQMSDSSRRATLIDVAAMKPEGRVYAAADYPELRFLEAYLPLSQIHVVNMPKAKDLDWQSLRAVWQLYGMLRHGNYDVVHLTSPLRYGSFLLYGLRRRMVLTMHDPVPHSSHTNWLNRFHRGVAFRMVDRFIVLSQSLKEEFVSRYHLQDKRVFLSRLGVYSHLCGAGLDAALRVSLDLPERFVLFAGSINPHKGIRYLCRAVELLRQTDPGLVAVVAGRGTFDFDIQPYVASGAVRLIHRFVTTDELACLMRASQMVCCPYVDATQSGVVMSAFALDKPVLATRTGALHEMIGEGRHGLLVEPSSAEALADGMRRMLSPAVLADMSRNIREDYALGDRSWQQIAQQHLIAYRSAERRQDRNSTSQ